MRLACTGGGTGGHIFPNIAVIEELRNVAVFYIGEKGSMEERIALDRHIPFFGIYAGKFRRYFSFRNFFDAAKMPVGFLQALLALKTIKPDLVFAKGGYVSAPVVLAARMLKIPVWIHESDVSPGLTTRFCARFAQKIFLSFVESKKFFLPGRAAARLSKECETAGRAALPAGRQAARPKNQNTRLEVAGNPIRKKLLEGNAEQGRKLTGFSDKKPIILIMGGSTGASAINNLIVSILPKLIKHANIIHITGQAKKFPVKSVGYRSFEFLDRENLANVYALSDFAVSRAGSGSIFELLAAHKPMILIPLPKSASRGDQIENAEAFANRGWAHVEMQERLAPERFLKILVHWIENDSLRAAMEENQKKAYGLNAAHRIADAIMHFT